MLLQLGESEKATLARPREKYINNTAKHTKNSFCLRHTKTHTHTQADWKAAHAVQYSQLCSAFARVNLQKCLLHIKQWVNWKRKCNLDTLKEKKKNGNSESRAR